MKKVKNTRPKERGVHHATSGNLDQRGIGDIDTLTVREYRALSRWRRLGYRVYRHPAVMFGVGPVYLFVLRPYAIACHLVWRGKGSYPGSAPWQPTPRSRLS
jgi:acyl-lipid omega-6 desaturase (Delta-12 desaturase)